MATTKKKMQGKINVRTFAMIAALLVIWLIFTLFTDNSFISTRNLSNLFRQMSIVGIMGVSMVLVIVTCGIDLSCGALSGFVSIFAAVLMAWHHWATVPTILVLLLVGIVVGTITGLLIAYANIPAFIVTLGMQMFFKGMMLAVGRGISISPMNKSFVAISDSYVMPMIGYIIAAVVVLFLIYSEIRNNNARRKFGLQTKKAGAMGLKIILLGFLVFLFVLLMNNYKGIPLPVMILLVLVAIFTFIAEKTQFGRSVYAIGGNAEAAKYAGINVKRNITIVYVLNGMMAAIAGIVLGARLNAGMPNAGMNSELDAIAAAVIGGASMSGGIGRVAGAILGALFMASIDNGMSMMNIDQSWQYMMKGAILVLAVWFDQRSQKTVAK